MEVDQRGCSSKSGGKRKASTALEEDPVDPVRPRMEHVSKRVPPVILHPKENWDTISAEMARLRIAFSKAKAVPQGIKVELPTAEAYRALVKMLDAGKHQYHTFALPDEKPLKVVFRGVPISIGEDSIAADLRKKGFWPETVKRLRQGSERRPIPLVLCVLKKSADSKRIFDLKTVKGLTITVESAKKKTEVGQCHRCQRFGHAQRMCKGAHRCVKCAGEHSTASCTKAKDAPAKCVLCGGPHTANYKGCPKHPKAAAETRAPAAIPKVKATVPPKAPVQAKKGDKPAPVVAAKPVQAVSSSAKKAKGNAKVASNANAPATVVVRKEVAAPKAKLCQSAEQKRKATDDPPKLSRSQRRRRNRRLRKSGSIAVTETPAHVAEQEVVEPPTDPLDCVQKLVSQVLALDKTDRDARVILCVQLVSEMLKLLC